MTRNVHFQVLQVPVLILMILLAAAMANVAQTPTPSPAPSVTPATDTRPTRDGLSEADPTNPILWSVRNEYRDLKDGAWSNTILLRHDRFAFRNLGFKGGAKGLVARFEVPINIVHAGNTTKTGLGDIYAQVLFAPRISRRFAFSLGSGLVLPTATDTMVGAGKLTIAPLAVPLWYMGNRRRLISLRVQHYVSVAGRSDRPDVNYTVIDPLAGWALSPSTWILVNTELKRDWRQHSGSGITGLQIGHMIADNMGFWIKPEILWGQGRQGRFNIKIGFFRFR